MKRNLSFHKAHSAAFAQYTDRAFFYTVPCCKCGGEGKDTVYSNQFVCPSCIMAESMESFFVAVAQIASERVVEKKSRKASPKPVKELVIVGREEENGTIQYYIQSGPENVYVSTLENGVATGCARINGEDCEAYLYSAHGHKGCKHCTQALQNERERDNDLRQHLEDEARAERERKQREQEIYRNMFPSDFGDYSDVA